MDPETLTAPDLLTFAGKRGGLRGTEMKAGAGASPPCQRLRVIVVK